MSNFYFEYVPDGAVEPALRALAADALARARLKLGLPDIRIRWIREISESSFRLADSLAALDQKYESLACLAAGRLDTSCKKPSAFVDEAGAFLGKVHPFGMKLAGGWRENEILVNVSTPAARLPSVIGHECKHLADFRDKRITTRSLLTPGGKAAAEKAADDFGEVIAWETPR